MARTTPAITCIPCLGEQGSQTPPANNKLRPQVWAWPLATVKDTHSPAGPQGMGWGCGQTAPIIFPTGSHFNPLLGGWGPILQPEETVPGRPETESQ